MATVIFQGDKEVGFTMFLVLKATYVYLKYRDSGTVQWLEGLAQDRTILSSSFSRAERPLYAGAPQINSSSCHSNKLRACKVHQPKA